jgi:hypothetical protein
MQWAYLKYPDLSRQEGSRTKPFQCLPEPTELTSAGQGGQVSLVHASTAFALSSVVLNFVQMG